jgi:Fic family protein
MSFYSKARVSAEDKAIFARIQRSRVALSGTLTEGESIDKGFQNWLKADQQVHEWVKEGASITLTRIRKLNRILGENLDFNSGSPGIFRNFAVGINDGAGRGSHQQNYLRADDIPEALSLFKAWTDEYEGIVHPIQLGSEAYQRLVSIHPFGDANGRTTRLVADWIYLRNGYVPPIYPTGGVDAAIFEWDFLNLSAPAGQIEEMASKGMINTIQKICRGKKCVETTR